MPQLYSEMGKEYARVYNKGALIVMAKWATTTQEALMYKANYKREKEATTGNYAEDNDASFFEDFANSLHAIIDVLD